MRILMGVIPDRHGTYYARKKVPKGLEEVVPRVLENGKRRLSWLKKSLGTKSAREANIRAKPVLIEFDRIIERARDLTKEQPLRHSLSHVEIARMAEFHYATLLGNDAASRRITRETREKWAAKFDADHLLPADAPAHGLTEEEFEQHGKAYAAALKEAQKALARGNIDYIVPEVEELLDDWFHIRLDRSSAAYRQLALAVLAQQVKALQAIQRRQAGEPIETPRQPETNNANATPTGETLRAAFQGWKKHRDPSPGTLAEYDRAIRLFTELHGDMPVAEIKRRHAREFRDALQDVPRHRKAELRNATLPELAEWGRAHPDAVRLLKGTINKLIGGVQAVAVWARDQGVIADDVQWADPFAP